MAKIGLAAQLAKQAAQAARDEVAAASGEAAPQAKKAEGWTVPQLAQDFMLDDAMSVAARKITGHYRNVLAPQGLVVALEPMMAEPAGQPTELVAPMRQQAADLQASLREQGTGRLVKAYTTPALLTMFATQQQATGLVVDGQV